MGNVPNGLYGVKSKSSGHYLSCQLKNQRPLKLWDIKFRKYLGIYETFRFLKIDEKSCSITFCFSFIDSTSACSSVELFLIPNFESMSVELSTLKNDSVWYCEKFKEGFYQFCAKKKDTNGDLENYYLSEQDGILVLFRQIQNLLYPTNSENFELVCDIQGEKKLQIVFEKEGKFHGYEGIFVIVPSRLVYNIYFFYNRLDENGVVTWDHFLLRSYFLSLSSAKDALLSISGLKRNEQCSFLFLGV